ncbi:hypothetical protein G6F57_015585 [Rhizopus arrhizus]|nr:hypothetical protein G6F29_013023 [Rhizopus arrhizus]KAG1001276.1 hypothetical protein G6F27_013027 [Rhizopus arrhizus]KAG1323836.1 hypothetical protein G6F63_012831 [Rhizopus arrhizus]KAG1454091.1 hypothetical protein G6F57_015585 [Rhizopus arrhizus]
MRQLPLLHPSCLPLPSAPTPSVRSRASSIYLSPVASVVSEDIDMPEFILEEQEKIDKTVVAAPPANIPFVSDVSPSTVVQSPGPPSVVVSSPTPSIASKMSLSPSSIHSTCETADHNVRGRTSLCRGGNVKTFLEETQPTSGMSNQPIEVEYNLPFSQSLEELVDLPYIYPRLHSSVGALHTDFRFATPSVIKFLIFDHCTQSPLSKLIKLIFFDSGNSIK